MCNKLIVSFWMLPDHQPNENKYLPAINLINHISQPYQPQPASIQVLYFSFLALYVHLPTSKSYMQTSRPTFQVLAPKQSANPNVNKYTIKSSKVSNSKPKTTGVCFGRNYFTLATNSPMRLY